MRELSPLIKFHPIAFEHFGCFFVPIILYISLNCYLPSPQLCPYVYLFKTIMIASPEYSKLLK